MTHRHHIAGSPYGCVPVTVSAIKKRVRYLLKSIGLQLVEPRTRHRSTYVIDPDTDQIVAQDFSPLAYAIREGILKPHEYVKGKP